MNDISPIKPPEEKKEKRAYNKISRRSDSIKYDKIVEALAFDNKSKLDIQKEFSINWYQLQDIIKDNKKKIDELKEKYVLERRNTLVPALYKQILDDLDHLKTSKKINKAKYGEILRGLKDLHGIARLEDNKSTENTEVNISGMTKEELLQYINNDK